MKKLEQTKSTGMFGISREKYYKIKQPKSKVPPVGTYDKNFKAVDKNTPAAVYGIQFHNLKEKSIEIKNRDFNQKT